MNNFEYARPSSLDEAVELLADGDAELLAGGIDLITAMKQAVLAPRRVVSLRDVEELRAIADEGEVIRVGAMATIDAMSSNESIQQHARALATLAGNISGAQVTSRATLGGNLCQRPRCWYYRLGYGMFAEEDGRALVPDGDNRYHAIFGGGPAYFVHPSGLAPALLVHDAEITLAGPDGRRTLSVHEFFRLPRNADERENVMAPGEIIVDATIPKGRRSGAYEVRQSLGLDWPLASAAVGFAESGGAAEDVRVALGFVAPIPWRAEAAENALEGNAPDEDAAQRCGEAAAEGAEPLSQNAYKARLVKTSVKRAVRAAAEA